MTVGAHFGYDQSSNSEVLGLQLRGAVLRRGQVQLVPHANVTFLPGLREYQYAIDAVWVSGGRSGGIYLGGGAGLRSSVFDPDASGERETRATWAAVVGLLTGGGAGIGTQVELRWIFLRDAEFDPRVVSLGVNLPIWSP